ncbi:MAG: PKD domain-containing protein [Ferruginibacter sp.]
MNKILLLLAFILFSLQLIAQDKSNRGKEFWLGYGYNYDFNNEAPVNGQTLAIYISTEEAAVVTVSVNNTGFTQTLNIPANSVDYSITIPKDAPDDARILTEGLSTHGIHIISDVPVVVYAHQYRSQLSGATMLMPVETYGYTYYSLNYTQTASNVNDWYSWFFIVAAENNTRLEITPSDTTQGGWLKGHTYIVNLNKGEIYNVFGKAIFDGTPEGASKDMTGSKIVSVTGADGNCHPIAVFSGSSGIRLCSGDGGEFVQQQVFPANAWGTRYLTYHTLNNTNTNVTLPNLNFYRIAVQDPTTVVKRNGVVLTGLTNNFYYEYQGTSGDYIEADKPILVAQYMMNINQCTGNNMNGYGDPEMFYISPIEQGVKQARFYNSRHYGIDYTYVNILLPTAGLASLLIDGAPLPAVNIVTHPVLANYSVAVARLIGPGAQHTITSDSTFTATVYGLGIFESYGYNVGCLVNNLNAYTGIQNTYNSSGNIDTFTCPHTQVKFYIRTAYLLDNIHWKLSQAGGGLSPNTDSVIVNPVPLYSGLINGRRYYTYTLQQDFTFLSQGIYFIPVTYESAAIDNCSHSETATIKVVVKEGPSADFSYSSLNCVSDSIHFTGITNAAGFNIFNYLWNFDDNSSILTQNAIKLFSAAGDQHVRYRIFADNGCTGDTTKLIHINDKPSASFNISGNTCIGDNFLFTSSTTHSNTISSNWYWDFGDAQTINITTGNTATHAYTNAANNIIVRHAVSVAGCKSDTVVNVISVIHSNPVADFIITMDTACEQKPAYFSATANPTITTWQWIFGNGTGTGTPPFTRNYNNAGIYTATLIVQDANGCNSSPVSNTITINPNPNIDAGPDLLVKIGTGKIILATISNAPQHSFLWTPANYLNNNSILNPLTKPDNDIVYTITAINNTTHCISRDSVSVKVVTDIYVPSAFSPNADYLNDRWEIPGLEAYPNAEVTVYNRYGQMIFHSKGNAISWDGTYKGAQQSQGSYVYVIATGDKKIGTLKGTVTLLR